MQNEVKRTGVPQMLPYMFRSLLRWVVSGDAAMGAYVFPFLAKEDDDGRRDSTKSVNTTATNTLIKRKERKTHCIVLLFNH